MKNLLENLSIQKEFVSRLSYSLRNFKWKQNGANFSCPICGDSQKNKTKARGYIFEKKNLFYYFCHNCGFSSNFSFFLHTVNPTLHKEYIKELFLDKKNTEKLMEKKPATKPPPVKIEKFPADSIHSLSDDHVAKTYVLRRKIPEKYQKELYYVNKFGDWVRKNFDPKYGGGNDERLIIPFYSGTKELVAFQGRALSGNSRLRYVTIKLKESAPKIYNFDHVDTKKTIYIVEGPIDAMCLPNAIAIAGSDVPKTLDKLNFDFVFVADREPRNPEIIKKISSMIDRKYKVCLLPDTMNGKDINEYILNDYSVPYITNMINKFTFAGIQATFQLKLWRKI